MSASTDLKPHVRATDMDPDQLHKVTEFVEHAFKQPVKDHRQQKVISRFLKSQMDKQDADGFGWNCVVGRNFGGHVIHQTKKYIFFQVKELSILLWKA